MISTCGRGTTQDFGTTFILSFTSGPAEYGGLQGLLHVDFNFGAGDDGRLRKAWHIDFSFRAEDYRGRRGPLYVDI